MRRRTNWRIWSSGFLAVGLAGCVADDAGRRAASFPTPARSIVAELPRERVIDLGRSVEGRPLTLVVFGAAPHPTFILGGIHGNEQNGAETAASLVAYLRATPAAWAGRSVAVLACANPDGTARGVRTNARKVDLNRNFAAVNWVASKWKGPYFGGTAAASEPETQAIVAAIGRLAPGRIVSIHSIGGSPCNNWDGPAEELARAMSSRNGYPLRASIGYPTPGSLGSWAGIDRGIPTITLELPHALAGPACWEQNREALLAAIREERSALGGSATGRAD